MANLTKEAIKKSLIKLLNERPINKITVNDIVEDCGINRNSFYYHFDDIPSLLEEMINREADRIIAEHSRIESIEECLEVAFSFALENKKAVLHIHNSPNREIYESYLWRVCEHVVRTTSIQHSQTVPLTKLTRRYLSDIISASASVR